MTTYFLVDTNNHTGYAQVVEEIQSGVVTKQFTFGHDLISQRQLINGNWTISFYGYDGHGSVRLLTNTAGAVTDTFDYDAFGNLINRTGTTPNDYLYTGEQFDSNLGFYYLRARYMNPSNGRFFTMDSYEGDAYDPLTLHKYLYAGNDPVNMIDPSGMFFDSTSLVTSTAASRTITAMSVAQAAATILLVTTLIVFTIVPPIRVKLGNYLFRGDDYYRGGPMGIPLDSDEADQADVQTVWEHLRKRSSDTSRFTSFTESYKIAKEKFGNNVYKVEIERLVQLEAQGVIRIYDAYDAIYFMRTSSDPKIQKDRFVKESIQIMIKNQEVLIEGQIPASIIQRAK
jgi:RHS repeat-associated protein